MVTWVFAILSSSLISAWALADENSGRRISSLIPPPCGEGGWPKARVATTEAVLGAPAPRPPLRAADPPHKGEGRKPRLARPSGGAFQRARHHDAADMLAVFDRPARIRGRRHYRLRRCRRLLQRRIVEAGSDHGTRGIGCEQRRFGEVGQADRAARNLASRHGKDDSGCGGGVIAHPALQLLIGVAVPGSRKGNRNRGQDLAGVECREIGALIEFGGCDLARPHAPPHGLEGAPPPHPP